MNLLIDPDELKVELAAIEAESIGWQPMGDQGVKGVRVNKIRYNEIVGIKGVRVI